MVTKQMNNSMPPEIDESWWNALLTEEDKFDQVGTRGQVKTREIGGF